jgi:TolB-like protein/DNA-binding SARP family transcriptional activator
MMFSLKLLGGATLERSGSPVGGRAARGQRLALLALLARGRPLSRDRVLALLYPESDTDRGRRTLSDSLYIIRTGLGEDVLMAPGDELRLNAERVSADVARFEQLLDEGRTEEAIGLYAGPFLDGFHLAECAEFEQWVDGERSRLAERYAAAIERLAEGTEQRKEWGQAVSWWRRLATLEPGNGRIARRLMLALDAAGDRAGALAHARVHAALLRSEYDAEPDAEMVALTERLRRESLVRGAGAAHREGRAEKTGPADRADAADTSLPPPEAGAAPVVVSRSPLAITTSAPLHLPAASACPSCPPRPRHPRVPRALAIAAGLAVLAAGSLVSWGSGGFPVGVEMAAAAPSPLRRSVAVLPFRNLSTDPDNTYFSDGLAEALIGALGRIEALRVAARTSSFAVGGRGMDVRAIGDTLGVAAVLEGSVRRDGDRLRVSARLADTETGYQLWSEEYDRELSDIFALQDEIARSIAQALEVKLAAGAPAARRPPTLEAYDLYLRGVFVRNKLTSEGLSRAVQFFDRAIQLDSSYALAYAGKVTALGPLVWYGHLPSRQGIPAMRAAARTALELDESLGEAHVAQGMVHFYFDRDWEATEREYRRAIVLNPSDQHAHHMYANFLVAMGRLDEGIAARRRALELDPLSHRSAMLLGRDLTVAGRYDEAIVQYRRAMEVDSTSPLALGIGQEGSFGLADAYAWAGRPAEAFAEYVRLARLEGIGDEEIGRFRRAYAEGGLSGYWRRRLDYELRRAGGRPEALRIASLLARVGDAEQTVRWIERAFDEQAMALPFIGVLPVYDGVRAHPRFAALLDRLRLADAARRRAESHRSETSSLPST